jgi:hypothetical protein
LIRGGEIKERKTKVRIMGIILAVAAVLIEIAAAFFEKVYMGGLMIKILKSGIYVFALNVGLKIKMMQCSVANAEKK